MSLKERSHKIHQLIFRCQSSQQVGRTVQKAKNQHKQKQKKHIFTPVMKITAILLAAFISLLAIEPTMNSIISQIADITIGCCSTDCKPFSDMEANEEQNNDCDKNCNPFQVCNSCVLLVSKVSAFYSLALPNVSLKQNCPPPSLFSSQYISDCWHPPKFV